jgi:UDP-glucose 4-epimerase
MSWKYLVTGGAGFIGSHIAEALFRKGERVRVLDNFSTGYRHNLAFCRRDLDLMEGDLRNPGNCRKAVRGVDFVLHCAALPSVPKSVQDPAGTNESNTTGTLNLLVAARAAGVKRLVYSSSSSVYGDSPALPKIESMPPEPLSPYAIQKYVGELYCRMFYQLYGFETVALRYFNVFGPRQDPKSEYAAVIPRFITALVRGVPPVIYGDGEQTRDFTYVDNVVRANLMALDAPGVAGEIFNFADGQGHSLKDLLRNLESILQTRIAPVHEPARPGDIRYSVAGVEKCRKLLGYAGHVSFEEGLRQTAAFFAQPEFSLKRAR